MCIRDSLSTLSAGELVKQLSGGELTAKSCTESFLDRIKQHDPSLNSFVSTAESAIAAAQSVDERRSAGKPVGALAGLPVAVKDGICTAGIATTAGSKMLEKFVPAFDATMVKQLIDADAVVIGKTNMDEFAMGSSTENSFFGVTKNPWSDQHVPGGSSGGSAACVAADMAPVSIGSDTGGSIRQPAAFCGITGLKPTYGRVSRFGLIAFASSLDQIGPMARSAEDCALVMNVISGHDTKDSTSAKNEVPDFTSTLNDSLKGLRIGICKEHFGDGLESEVENAVTESVKVLQSLGAETVEISLPHTPYALSLIHI